MSSPQRIGRWLRWWIIGYAALVGAVVAAMIWARRSTVAQLSSPKSISDWQAWREDVREQQQLHSGPVKRRVPKSDEPPALTLLRDYFTVMMVGALLFSSMLYWVLAWFITGIFIGGREGDSLPSG